MTLQLIRVDLAKKPEVFRKRVYRGELLESLRERTFYQGSLRSRIHTCIPPLLSIKPLSLDSSGWFIPTRLCNSYPESSLARASANAAAALKRF
jgi:hypothetical protein